jgi:hypothetical protein
MREPSEGMVDAVFKIEDVEGFAITREAVRPCWQAMIDALLSESPDAG